MERHEHGGKSTRGVLDPQEILSRIGLEKGMVFMDGGCGDGYVSIAASKVVEDTGEVYAIDVHKEGLEHLIVEASEKGLENIHIILADLTKRMPIEDSTVDLCLLANVFHGIVYNDETENTLCELSRIIKRNGRLVVLEPRKDEEVMGPPLEVRLTALQVKENLENHGFSVREVMNIGEGFFVVVSKKIE